MNSHNNAIIMPSLCHTYGILRHFCKTSVRPEPVWKPVRSVPLVCRVRPVFLFWQEEVTGFSVQHPICHDLHIHHVALIFVLGGLLLLLLLLSLLSLLLLLLSRSPPRPPSRPPRIPAPYETPINYGGGAPLLIAIIINSYYY